MNKVELDQIFIMTFRGYEIINIKGIEGNKVIIQGKDYNSLVKEDLHHFYKLTITPVTVEQIKQKLNYD